MERLQTRQHILGRALSVITIALIVAVLLAVAVEKWTSTASAAFPAAQGRITFESNMDGAWQIFTMNADGTGLIDVTKDVKYTTWPSINSNNLAAAWSPDGTKVAFMSDRDYTGSGSVLGEMYVLNADGTGLNRLTSGGVGWSGVSPSWSPDGSKIAFNNVMTGQKIYVINADGTGLTDLSQGNTSDSEPNWSPDGSKIAFSSNNAIYTMNPDGSNRIFLTNGGYPDWSPDGSQIVFSPLVSLGGWERPRGICTIKSDGTGLTHLSSDGYNPAWSPDGLKIAFERFRIDNDTTLGGGADIYLMNVDGTGLVNLTNNSADNRTNEWQPLPLAVIFTSPPWTTNADSHITATLTDDGSGIDANTLAVMLDGNKVSGCSLVSVQIDCPLTGVSEGSHQVAVTYKTHNGKGGYGTTALGVDQTAPSIGSLNPDSWTRANTTLSAAVSDYGSGIDTGKTGIHLDGATEPLAGCSVDSTHIECQVSGLSEGHHTMSVTATDLAGNNASQASGFDVDTGSPVINQTGPTGSLSSGSAVITALYSDSDSGINQSSIKLTLNGQDRTPTIYPDHLDYNYGGGGSVQVHLQVSDNAGNTSTADWSFSMPDNLYFPWYDTIAGSTWLLAAQPAGSGDNLVDFWMKTNPLQQAISVHDGTTYPNLYPGRMGGPIKVVSQTGTGISSERSLFGNSFEEIWSTSYDDLDSHYYWPVYLGSLTSEWVLVSNPAENGEPVYVDISIKGAVDGNNQPVGDINVYGHEIQPGDTWTPSWPYSGEPVEVKAYRVGGSVLNPADARKVIASERILVNGAFNEMAGIPASKMTNDYEWTWYDSVNSDDMLAIGNPNGSPIYLFVYLHGQLIDSSPAIGAGGTVAWDSNSGSNPQKLIDGPIEVKGCFDQSPSCANPANIFTSQIVFYGPSYEETAGIPVNSLKPTSNWTWYDESSRGSANWVLVANPNATSIYYEISIPGQLDPVTNPNAHGVLGPGQRVTPDFPGIMGGPVQVKAWADASKTNPTNVMASQRVLWNGYFNEVVGKGM